MRLTILSGVSGGGKSTALRALEDLGVFCVDNCPIPLLPELVELVKRSDEGRAVAVCVDARDTEHLASFDEACARLERMGVTLEVLFVEAANDVLVRRFAETRRLHPMGELPGAIDREREALAPIRNRASATIDSSTLVGRQLRQLVRDRYAGGTGLRVVLQSFAYRRGVPSEADMVFDCRFLANPYEDPALRPLSGLHEPVARFVLEQADARTLLDHVETLVRFVIPRMRAEGRSYLTVALGCTGGQHRSVALVEALQQRLAPERGAGLRVVVRHRDVGRSP
ncbi:MAG: RNase adapter RapZ [Nannocystaceae bacterium]|nr:RNase adapter RapZ [Nannocystaceae bacterium]